MNKIRSEKRNSNRKAEAKRRKRSNSGLKMCNIRINNSSTSMNNSRSGKISSNKNRVGWPQEVQ